MSADLEKNDALSALESAFLTPIDLAEEKFIVRAEDMTPEGGAKVDFSKHYFEPSPGHSYLIKILPQAGYPVSEHVSTRILYRSLPDPERKGKAFHYVASGERNDPVLTLFFELYRQNEGGDPSAQLKIDKYLKRSSQACVKIQILHTTDENVKVGDIRLFVFPNAGQNATISQLIEKKLNPTASQIAAGFERENIFNIFGSSVIALECKESSFGDGQKARDYSASDWSPKKRGALGVIRNDDGTVKSQHEFSEKDLVSGHVKDDVKPFFEAFVKEATNPDTDLYRWFKYKKAGDPRNDEELNTYLQGLESKVKLVVPMIRSNSLANLQSYFSASAEDDGEDNGDNKKDILKASIPNELKDVNEVFKTDTSNDDKDIDVDAILKDMK
jgi:hypothetical protein